MLIKLLCLLLNYWLSYREITLNIEKIQLNEKIDYFANLNEGLMIARRSLQKNSPIIIMGHSGIGPLALFNNIIALNENDLIEVTHLNKSDTYYVTEKKTFKKGSDVSLFNDDNYLYLITCDLNDYSLQWLIVAQKFNN